MAQREIVVNLKLSDQSARQQFEALSTAIEGLNVELSQARSEFKKNEKELLALSAALKQGKITQDQYAIATANLNAAQQGVARNIANLKSSVGGLRTVYREVANEVNGATAAQLRFRDKIGQGFGAATTELKNYALGFVGVVAAAQAVISVISNATKTIVEFDKANANLAAILGTTRSKITELSESAIRIGPAFARAPQEVTELQTELAKLGFTVPEIIAAQEAIITLANATEESLGKSAEVAAATLNAFNLEAADTARVVDVIAQAANSTSLDLEKFSVAISTVGPTAVQAGLSIEETTALVGVLADRGVDASVVGTSLRSIFTDLAKTGKPLNEALDEINNSTNKTNTAFELFGERAASQAVILAENRAEIEGVTEALNNAGGAAARVANEQLSTLSGGLDQLSAAWNGLILDLDNGKGKFSEFLGNIISGATALVEALGRGSALDQNLAGFTKRVQEEFNALGGVGQLGSEIGDGLTNSFRIAATAAAKYGNTVEDIQLLETSRNLIIQRSSELQERFNKSRREGGEALKNEELVQLAAAQASISAIGVEIKKRRELADVKTAGAASATTEAEKIKTVKEVREALTAELQAQKDKKDALLETDAKGRAAADAEIERINNQIKALDTTSKQASNAAGSVNDLNAQVSKLQKLLGQSNDAEQIANYQSQIDKLRDSIDLLTGKTKALPPIETLLTQAPENQETPEPPTNEETLLRLGINPNVVNAYSLTADELAQLSEDLRINELEAAGDFNDQLSVLEADYLAGRIQGLDEYGRQKAAILQAQAEQEVEIQYVLNAAKAEAVGALGQLLTSVAKEGTTAAKIGLAVEKAAAIATVIFNLQKELAVLSFNTTAFPISAPINAARALAAKIRAGASIATIVAQGISGFAEGGEVNGEINRSHGRPIRRANGDNIMITARTGEKILNQRQQQRLEDLAGDDVWARIGLRGFGNASSDMLGAAGFLSGGTVRGTAVVNASAPDLSAIESLAEQRAFDFQVVADIEEITSVMDRRMKILEISRG